MLAETAFGILKSLMAWQLYVVLISYGILFIGAQLALTLVMPIVSLWCMQVHLRFVEWLMNRVVIHIPFSILMVLVVLTLSPIILGFGNAPMWDLPWYILTDQPLPFLKLVGLIVVSLLVLSFVPIIGKLGIVQSLVAGGICLVLILEQLHKARPSLHVDRIGLLPGFWEGLGYIALSGIAGSVLYFMLAMAVHALKLPSRVQESAMFLAAIVAGFLPLLTYGAWLGAQLARQTLDLS